MKLLSINQDVKTKKGLKEGFLTGIMYFAPYKISGFNVCSSATTGCIKSCLYSAGMGVFNNVQKARINRTLFFKNDQKAFFKQLIKEITALINKAKKEGLKPVIRLNGTSDIPYENIAVIHENKLYNNIFTLFNDVQFYDYTKVVKRLTSTNYTSLRNYVLTFSRAENNTDDCIQALKSGINVASVFKEKLPNSYKINSLKYQVLNGDLTDLRFKDKSGVIIGLLAKGKAKKDNTGFVINNHLRREV